MASMRAEALEAPETVGQQVSNYQSLMPGIIKTIKQFNPKFIVTVGRGSSDHAANFAKYIFETQLHLVTASSAPSIQTIYQTPLHFKQALVIAFSQSGQSSDICEVIKNAKTHGALTIACVNQTSSPLAEHADIVIPLFAGQEKAVAATKSYIATLVSILALTAYWLEDDDLIAKLFELEAALTAATQINVHALAAKFFFFKNTLVLGRGYTFPVALEAALKFKETCKMHAEAFSWAEVMHGPFALLKKDFPLLIFGPSDRAVCGLDELLAKLQNLNTQSFVMMAKDKVTTGIKSKASLLLELPQSLHPLYDPLVAIQAFYLMVEQCAHSRGIDPDHPDNISKVTDTL
jgi:glutamine---fructose-6-phosphate transaminase (isomerizing)